MQMSFPVRFPAIYERVSPFRTVEEIELEMDRRCGLARADAIAPVRHVDPEEAREGTPWERKSTLAVIRAQKIHEPMPLQLKKSECPHGAGVVRYGSKREKCRQRGLTRVVGKKTWKRTLPPNKFKSELC